MYRLYSLLFICFFLFLVPYTHPFHSAHVLSNGNNSTVFYICASKTRTDKYDDDDDDDNKITDSCTVQVKLSILFATKVVRLTTF